MTSNDSKISEQVCERFDQDVPGPAFYPCSNIDSFSVTYSGPKVIYGLYRETHMQCNRGKPNSDIDRGGYMQDKHERNINGRGRPQEAEGRQLYPLTRVVLPKALSHNSASTLLIQDMS